LPGQQDLPAPEELPPEAAKMRLFTALAGLLGDYAHDRPLLLAMDDLQWADDLSVEFLRWFATGERTSRVCIVASCRAEEMSEALLALESTTGVSRERLARLDQEGIRRMVASILALPSPPGALVDYLHEESDGNPFFIAEYLRSTVGAGVLYRDAAGNWNVQSTQGDTELRGRVLVPPTIQELIARRLQDLPAATLEILQAAAVLGRAFDLDLAASIAGRDTSLILDAYADLSQRQILEEDENGVPRFVHDKLREVAYAEIAGVNLPDLHRRAAAALEAKHASDLEPLFGTLGHHHAKAGGRTAAADYFERAANHARRIYANRDAIRLLRLALEQLEGPPDDGGDLGDRRSRVQESIGDLLLLAGDAEASRGAYLLALEGADAARSPVARARRLRKVAQTWERKHLHTDALAAYERAESALTQVESEDRRVEDWWREYILIQVDKAWVLYFSARIPELEALVERVRPAVAKHGQPLQRARYHQAVVNHLLKKSRYLIDDAVLHSARASLEAAQEHGEVLALANAQFFSGMTLSIAGRDEEGEPLFAAAVEGAARAGDAALNTRFLAYFTVLVRRLGKVERARDLASQTLSIAESAGMKDYIGVARANMAWCSWHEGRFDEAKRDAVAALATWDSLAPTYVYPFQWIARAPLAVLLSQRGRDDEALAHWKRLLADPQQVLPVPLHEAIEQATGTTSLAGIADLARHHRLL
jgi:tetratricopeptide (TPR) repeat protein